MHLTIVESSLGHLLVGVTDRGLRAAALGDDPDALRAAFSASFGPTAAEDDAPELEPWVSALLASIEDPAKSFNLPLDLQGTPFQLLVWNALREIPCGETRTYSQIAQAIGRPTAARAVARACASNEIAVIVPCHRVVRSSGELSGYRWGVERKRAILEREALSSRR